MCVDRQKDPLTREDVYICTWVPDPEPDEIWEQFAKEEEIKRLETQIKILKLAPNECLVADNQQLYDVLCARAKDPATPAAEKRGCRRAAVEVRKFETSWFEDVDLWEHTDMLEDIGCWDVVQFMIRYGEEVRAERRKAGTGGY